MQLLKNSAINKQKPKLRFLHFAMVPRAFWRYATFLISAAQKTATILSIARKR